MTPSPADRARAAVARAQADLDAALAAGGDTTKPRETLELARAELSSVLTKNLADAQPAMTERRAQIDADARELLDEAYAALTAAAPIKHPDTPAIPDLPAGIAQALAAARWELADMRAKATEHGTRVDALRARLATLETERNQIIERRAQGHHEKDDGPRLALLDADREGLASLIQRTEAEAPDPNPAAALVDDWRRQWDRAVNEVRTAKLKTDCDHRARELAAALLELRRVTGSHSAPWHGWAELDRIRNGLVVA